MIKTQLETLWAFIRADLAVLDFETWLYGQEGLEVALGAELYLAMLSVNYRKMEEVFDIKQALKDVLPAPTACECHMLPNLAVVPMGMNGLDQRVFATVEEVVVAWPEQSWLSSARCRTCGQDWLIAAEELIYDDHLLRRLTAEETDDIEGGKAWPTDFDTYEKVLVAARDLSRPCRFIDPMSPALVYVVRNLIADRSNIQTAEIAWMMGIDVEQVEVLKAEALKPDSTNHGAV